MTTTMAKKSFTKRIKVTKTGKLLRRKKGIGHARAKKSSNTIRNKRKMVTVKRVDKPGILDDIVEN